MKPKHQRLLFVSITAVCAVAATLFILTAFRDNIIFFLTPSEMLAGHPEPGRTVRLGGLVEKGSVIRHGLHVEFRVTDGKAEIPVQYDGLLPALFREGQGVVAEGIFSGGMFTAKQVLAKHDERYMPKDVEEKLKATGHWHGP